MTLTQVSRGVSEGLKCGPSSRVRPAGGSLQAALVRSSVQSPAGHGQHLRLAASPTLTVPPQAACRVVLGGPWGLLGLGGRCSLCSGPSRGLQWVREQVWRGRPVLRAQDTACSRPGVRPTQGCSQNPQGREPREDWGGHCSGGKTE